VKIYPPTKFGSRQLHRAALRRFTGFPLFWFGWCLTLAGCASSPSTVPSQTESFPHSRGDGWFAGCASPSSQPRLPVRLAVHSTERTKTGTTLHVVAYTTAEAGILQLPLYTMSRGRWSIGEKGRAFLLDQDCRSYPLLDVAFAGPRVGPGQIRLAPGKSIDGTLRFPPFSGRPQMALLVYDTERIPFFVPPQSPSAVGPVPSSDPSELPR
jgi:hypothetical protein